MSIKRATSISMQVLLITMTALFKSQIVLANTCDIQASQTKIDFGPQHHPSTRANIGTNNLYEIGSRSFSLSGNCEDTANIMLVLRSNHTGADFLFAEHGQIKVRFSNAAVDGRPVELAVIKAQGEAPGSSVSSLYAVPGSIVVPVVGGATAEGKFLSIQVDVIPSLSSSDYSVRSSRTAEANLSFELSQLK